MELISSTIFSCTKVYWFFTSIYHCSSWCHCSSLLPAVLKITSYRSWNILMFPVYYCYSIYNHGEGEVEATECRNLRDQQHAEYALRRCLAVPHTQTALKARPEQNPRSTWISSGCVLGQAERKIAPHTLRFAQALPTFRCLYMCGFKGLATLLVAWGKTGKAIGDVLGLLGYQVGIMKLKPPLRIWIWLCTRMLCRKDWATEKDDGW